MLEKKLFSEEELCQLNFERLKNLLVYIKNDLIDPDDNMIISLLIL